MTPGITVISRWGGFRILVVWNVFSFDSFGGVADLLFQLRKAAGFPTEWAYIQPLRLATTGGGISVKQKFVHSDEPTFPITTAAEGPRD